METQEHETKARTQVPDVEMPKEVEETPKGKIKSLFRKLETSLINEIDRRLNGINAQVGKIHDQLDKKFGGMYKVLIHQFLTKQETKIYNAEIAVQSIRELLADYLYSVESSTETKEEFMKRFDEEFQAKAIEVDKRIKAKLAEEDAKKSQEVENGEVSKEQGNQETQESAGQDSNG